MDHEELAPRNGGFRWSRAWARAWAARAAGLAVLSVLLGAGLSVGTGVALDRQQQRFAREQFDRRTILVQEAVAAETSRYIDALRTVAAAVGSFDKLTADKFAQTTQPLRSMRLAGVTGIGFAVPATNDRIAAVQALWRTRGLPDLVLVPRDHGDEHIFSIFSTRLDSSTPAKRTGTDITQAAVPTAALAEARRSGGVAVSDAYELLRDQHLPPEQRQMSFALAMPVYYVSPAGHRAFRGWVSMGLHGQDFIGTTMRGISQDLVDVTLRAANADQVQAEVASVQAAAQGERDLTADADVEVANRRWHLRLQANSRELLGGATSMPVVVGAAGVGCALMLGALVFVLATGRVRAQARLVAATAELRSAEAASRRQAGLMEAVMNSISDGVGVVDERGEFIMHNTAAKAMLALEDKGGAENWQSHYGIYRVDGRSPFPTEELPLVRALAGESCEQVEMVIRNPGRPEGMVISVSAQPLDAAAGQSGAVAVFHDISDRKRYEIILARATVRLESELARRAEIGAELRRAEATAQDRAAALRVELARREATEAALLTEKAELTAFAGVVAHDLKAPLAGVAGFAEILATDLRHLIPEALDPAVSRNLDYITTGVQRMSRLIDDLLAYATAREGAFQPRSVDLQALVAEVIAERTEHLRAGHANPDGERPLFPDIYTGPLPTVYADPAMCRQLLDNMVGNALKYTMPGRAAVIEISAHRRSTDDTVRVEIADRGIGIPPEQHQEIFNAFHRADTGGRYLGTGLGLAICKRVVERHRGTISVSDNPGGGSRFQFTLPLAPHLPTAAPDAVEIPAPDPDRR